ncbi:MAG TPA: serine hydrolase domain-containing protein [Vicinamibacterales bacterium]|nr:serine hydrolase domain-containing protein [Vicinamibacterales bacterium]
MPTKRMQTWLAVMVVAVGLLLAAIAGLWAYMSATATPLHPSPRDVPSVAAAAPSPTWASAAARAEQIVRANLTEQNLPGLSAAVGVGGEIAWAEGFGWADLDDRAPVTPDTRFRTGDTSKALTSAAVGLLLEKNTLRLDDEIHAYVPEYPGKPWPITLRQLMAQTAGLTTDPGDEAWMTPCERTLDGLTLFAKDRLLFEPGTRYEPSSYGWILVSAAVEAAAHEPFFRFMRAHVFEPLGMADTQPDSATEPIPNRATFYFPRFAGNTRYGPESVREGDHTCYAGGGAFLSTPSDLVRFGMGINSGRLLQPATVTLLQTAQRLPSGDATGYGLGWKVETLPLAGEPARMAGHGTKPDFIGTTAYLMTFPQRGIVVAVMANISFADMKTIALGIAQAFAEAAKSPGRGGSPVPSGSFL